MELEIKKNLFDIHESIESIEKYPGDKRDYKIYLIYLKQQNTVK